MPRVKERMSSRQGNYVAIDGDSLGTLPEAYDVSWVVGLPTGVR